MKVDYRRLRLVGAALAATTLAGAAEPAQAGSVYLNGLGVGGGAASVPLESFQERKFKTTIAQEHDFSCGSAALATLLSYNYGISVTEQSVFAEMFANGDQQVISEAGFFCST